MQILKLIWNFIYKIKHTICFTSKIYPSNENIQQTNTVICNKFYCKTCERITQNCTYCNTCNHFQINHKIIDSYNLNECVFCNGIYEKIFLFNTFIFCDSCLLEAYESFDTFICCVNCIEFIICEKCYKPVYQKS